MKYEYVYCPVCCSKKERPVEEGRKTFYCFGCARSHPLPEPEGAEDNSAE